MKRFTLSLVALAGLLTASVIGTAAYAHATGEPGCVSGAATTWRIENVARPDSGASGHGNWANDVFTRTINWSSDCKGTYTFVVDDQGTFTTIANGFSPQAGTPFGPSFTGSIRGGALLTVKSSTRPHFPVMPVGGWPSTGDWPSTMFDGEHDTKMGAWGWTYATPCEHWTNASTGNQGDVTGCTCPPTTTTTTRTHPAPPTWTPPHGTTPPHPTSPTLTTPTTPKPPPVTTSLSETTPVGLHQNAGSGGGGGTGIVGRASAPLAYTGASVGWLVALGALLLLTGGLLLVGRLYRRRSSED